MHRYCQYSVHSLGPARASLQVVACVIPISTLWASFHLVLGQGSVICCVQLLIVLQLGEGGQEAAFMEGLLFPLWLVVWWCTREVWRRCSQLVALLFTMAAACLALVVMLCMVGRKHRCSQPAAAASMQCVADGLLWVFNVKVFRALFHVMCAAGAAAVPLAGAANLPCLPGEVC